MDIFYHILGLILIFKAFPVEAGNFCSYLYTCNSGYCTGYTYCDLGCCGLLYSTYNGACCTNNFAGIIAGAVTGGLVGLGLIALIVYCCVAANKSGNRRGVVMEQMYTSQVHTVAVPNAAVTTGSSYGPVAYGHPADQQAPPPYTLFNIGASTYPPPKYC